jgi:hypothetical protein
MTARVGAVLRVRATAPPHRTALNWRRWRLKKAAESTTTQYWEYHHDRLPY